MLRNPVYTGETPTGGIVTSGPREETDASGESDNGGASTGEVTITIKD